MGILANLMYIMVSVNTLSEMSAEVIINRVDSSMNAPRTKKAVFLMELIDASGNIEKREGITYEEKGGKRFLKFTEPASIRGIAFLSLPGDIMYIYLPAFRKERRIATSVKNTNFSGTDFTYDELSTFKYAEKYKAEFILADDSVWKLKLLPRSESEYDHLVMYVDKKYYIPLRVEFYDKNKDLCKILEEKDVKKVRDYYVPTLLCMKDLKQKHQTTMKIKELELDVNIPAEVFTIRYLRR